MAAARAYAILCGAWGVVLLLMGLALFSSFFAYHAPGGSGLTLFPMGPNGHYFAGLAGTALVVWGGCLLGAARRPGAARAVGTASALGLVLAAIQRMVAWLMGDYALLGELPRIEAALCLLLALGFVWLRPAPAASGRE